jgi:[acyl-carrier-protein] S-malonyltransferase
MMQNLHTQKTKDKITWVFPGQSSQRLGMGLDLLAHPFAQARFQQAEQFLGWSVPEVCQNKDKLSCTLYTQPCLYVVETLLAELIRKEGCKPNLVAGYSLGEYAAIYVAGAFDFETGLHLIKRRAELMNRAPKGRMVALIGFEPEQLEQQILHTPNVWRVNDDLTIAIISGTFQAVESLLTKVEIKRVIPLNVDRPFHTPLMVAAAAEFQQILESTSFDSLEVPMLSSTELVPTVEIARLKKSLVQQMCEPIKWRAISLSIATQGITEVVEIGPGKELMRQMKRICPGLAFTNVSNLSKLIPCKARHTSVST